MPFSSQRKLKKEPKGYCRTLPKIFLQTSNHHLMNKIKRLKVSLDLEFEAPKLVKVKAHKRIRNGKVVKVRSYYRRVEGREVISGHIFM